MAMLWYNLRGWEELIALIRKYEKKRKGNKFKGKIENFFLLIFSVFFTI